MLGWRWRGVDGIGLLAHTGWWAPISVVAVLVSTVLILSTFSRWFVVGLVIDAAILIPTGRPARPGVRSWPVRRG